jgi:hypothetical protein
MPWRPLAIPSALFCFPTRFGWSKSNMVVIVIEATHGRKRAFGYATLV